MVSRGWYVVDTLAKSLGGKFVRFSCRLTEPQSRLVNTQAEVVGLCLNIVVSGVQCI